MEKSLKILKIFGFLELALGIIGAVLAIMGNDWTAWLNVAVEFLTAFLLLSAVKDPPKYIDSAWAVTLLAFILSLLDLRLLRGEVDTLTLVVYPIVAVLNLVVFLAAHKVRRTVSRKRTFPAVFVSLRLFFVCFSYPKLLIL